MTRVSKEERKNLSEVVRWPGWAMKRGRTCQRSWDDQGEQGREEEPVRGHEMTRVSKEERKNLSEVMRWPGWARKRGRTCQRSWDDQGEQGREEEPVRGPGWAMTREWRSWDDQGEQPSGHLPGGASVSGVSLSGVGFLSLSLSFSLFLSLSISFSLSLSISLSLSLSLSPSLLIYLSTYLFLALVIFFFVFSLLHSNLCSSVIRSTLHSFHLYPFLNLPWVYILRLCSCFISIFQSYLLFSVYLPPSSPLPWSLVLLFNTLRQCSTDSILKCGQKDIDIYYTQSKAWTWYLMLAIDITYPLW